MIELIILFSVAAEMVSMERSMDCSYVQLVSYQLQPISDSLAEFHLSIPTQLSAKVEVKVKKVVFCRGIEVHLFI